MVAKAPMTAPDTQAHQETKKSPAKYEELISSFLAVVKIAKGSSVIKCEKKALLTLLNLSKRAKTHVLIMKYLKFKITRPIQIATKLALSFAEVTAKN